MDIVIGLIGATYHAYDGKDKDRAWGYDLSADEAIGQFVRFAYLNSSDSITINDISAEEG